MKQDYLNQMYNGAITSAATTSAAITSTTITSAAEVGSCSKVQKVKSAEDEIHDEMVTSYPAAQQHQSMRNLTAGMNIIGLLRHIYNYYFYGFRLFSSLLINICSSFF